MKKQRLEMRISSLEKEILKKKAAHAGLSVADYCRRAALNQKVTYKLTAEELEVYKELHRFRSNFVNLSNLIKRNDPALSDEMKAAAVAVTNHLKKLQ